MPWKECHVMDERLRFVARLLEGEKRALLCGDRRRRRPVRPILPAPIEATIVRLKREYRGWGAP